MKLGPIIPIHMRALEAMRVQLVRCPQGFGPIGIDFLNTDPTLKHLKMTSREVLQPLVDRRLAIYGDVIPLHLRITGFGLACLALGWMPQHAMPQETPDAELVQELKIEGPRQKALEAPTR